MQPITPWPGLRTRRDRTGTVRIYLDGLLLGSMRLVRVKPEGRRAVTLWQAKPAVSAWTGHAIGAAIPPPELRADLPPMHARQADAIGQLIHHLRGATASGVAHLFETEPASA